MYNHIITAAKRIRVLKIIYSDSRVLRIEAADFECGPQITILLRKTVTKYRQVKGMVITMIYERYSKRVNSKLTAALNVYSKLMYKAVGSIADAYCLETSEHLRQPPKPDERFGSGQCARLEAGRRWGGEWRNMWICGKCTVPENAAGKRLYAIVRANAVEILCFVDNVPTGIINSKNDFVGGRHSATLICTDAKPCDSYSLAFECYAGHFCAGGGPYDSYGQTSAPNSAFIRTYDGVDICVEDETVSGFVYDLQALLGFAERLPDSNFLKARAQNSLERVLGELIQDPLAHDDDEIHLSLTRCREIMAETLSHRDNTCDADIFGYAGIIGHSHMDTAWLWPMSETIRKCARTYSNVLTLMKLYPEYKFIQSSALHLDWMRRYYPTIFDGIKQRCAEGRYEPNGGVWVECDCNMTSGEAMVRQFLYGQRFTEKYLGYRSDTFWLPDTFGYNATIPQIMRGCGIKYFCTTKMAWNDLNEFPHDSFVWRGNDGSEVLVHLNTMQAQPIVESILPAVSGIKHKQVFPGRLVAYGFGDGGGGPTAGMLEQAKRITDIPGLPVVRETTVSEFMQKLEREAVGLPVFSGELYLELHRGTLTQMHDIKRGNRYSEVALHNLEYMNSLSKLLGGERHPKLDEFWEILLKNQFHDILPGSSIPCVNETAIAEQQKLIADANTETMKYAASLTDSDDKYITLFNPTSFEYTDIVYLDNIEMGQRFTDVRGRERYAFDPGVLPPLGARSYPVGDYPVDLSMKFQYDDSLRHITTKFADIRLDENGYIESYVDIGTDREVRRNGGEPLNKFYICEDLPQAHDNWDIDADITLKKLGRVEYLGSRVVSVGSSQLRIRSEYNIGRSSRITQDMIFSAKSPRIDFHTLIDWHEKHALLKVGFDVDVSATTARHEMQFGHTERPTTRNNSHEAAQFEVCCHKWSDLSENRFGVALLNDCKYGISVDGSDMRLTLHRGGTHPDTTGDEGIHELTYSLYVHDGGFVTENTVKPAYALNYPPIVTAGQLNEDARRIFGQPNESAPAQMCCQSNEAAPAQPRQSEADSASIVSLSAPNVVVETIKPAEDIENGLVVRLYECERSRAKCRVTLPCQIREAYIVDMLEENRVPLEIADGSVQLDIKPLGIVTLLLIL